MTFLAYERTQDYGERPAPSLSESAFTSIERPGIRSLYAVQAAIDWSKGEPGDENLRNSVNLLDYKLSHPDFGVGQKVGNTVAGIAGFFLDPVGLAAGGIIGKGAALVTDMMPEYVSAITNGGLARETISELLNKSIPVFANNKFAKYLPASFHDILETEAHAAGSMAGFTLPESFLSNYDADNNRLDYGGMVRSIAFEGGIGLALPPIAWTAGLILGKVERGLGENIKNLSKVERNSKLEKALAEGHINQEEHDWLKNVYDNPGQIDDHLKGSIKLLGKENHPVNTLTGDIELPFMSQDEVKQLQTFSLDQMASDTSADYKTALSDFTTRNMLDRMTTMLKENPSMMDGVKAHVDEVTRKLEQRVNQLEKEDYYIERTTTRKATRVHPISQEKLSKMMGRGNLKPEEMPFIIPENLKEIGKQENSIMELENKSKNYEREFNKTGKAKFQKFKAKANEKLNETKVKLEDYKKGEGKILSQADELAEIRKRLIGGEEMPKNYHLSTDYLRLLDLAHVYPQAKGLMRMIAQREQYELQAAYNEVLKGIVNIAENGLTKVANPERVINYFKERIEGAASIKDVERYMAEKVDNVSRQVDKVDENLQEKFDQINSNADLSRATKDEFNVLFTRMNQFKENKFALNDLVKCIMEAENVRV